MARRLIALVFMVLTGCSTPEERIEKLHYALLSGRITQEEYNAKLRKYDWERLKPARENFMRP